MYIYDDMLFNRITICQPWPFGMSCNSYRLIIYKILIITGDILRNSDEEGGDGFLVADGVASDDPSLGVEAPEEQRVAHAAAPAASPSRRAMDASRCILRTSLGTPPTNSGTRPSR